MPAAAVVVVAPVRRFPFALPGDAPPPKTWILMSEFWSDCLSLLKQKLSAQQYDAWIRPLSARETEGKILVTAPSRKALEWVREQYLPDIQKFAHERG
ncbi:MAG: hypothetical protein K2W80_07005, partial [Burkholderiales bacterium]|nr:hypothetical protein [Burkholderiales bacterium]